MARCSTCGKDVEKPSREWDLGKVHVKQYECCGKKFREYEKKVQESRSVYHESTWLVKKRKRGSRGRSSVKKRVVSDPCIKLYGEVIRMVGKGKKKRSKKKKEEQRLQSVANAYR